MNRWSLVLIALALLGPACSKEPPADGQPSARASDSLPDRDPALAKRLVSEGALLLDVRTQQEWDERHLEGAHLVPVQQLESRMSEIEKLTGGDKDKPIVVYCRSGGRAGQAKQMLTKAGYHKVTNLGGIDDWPAK